MKKIAAVLLAITFIGTSADADQWTHFGGDAGGTRYSPISQITSENVQHLEKVWTYQSGDLINRPNAMKDAALEVTPIIFAGSLIYCTPFNEVIALDPASGTEKWRFDPEIDTDGMRAANQFVCRGVTPHTDDQATVCRHSVLMGTIDARLFRIDAETGLACDAFGGDQGVALPHDERISWRGEFQITSAPAVIGDIVVTGSAIGDNTAVDAPKGTVYAFDIKTGAMVWSFDPLSGSPDISAGHANVWSTISVDEDRGLIFLPVGSASPDFYGGLRPGDNLYANSVVALNAITGTVVWHFQTVHHDIWDYDLASQPLLSTLTLDGKEVPVVIQPTKTGLVFTLHRETGQPVIPVEERPVPQSAELGEALSPTQPFPVAPPPLHPHVFDPEEAWGLTFIDSNACLDRVKNYRSEGVYTPPTLQGTVFFPFTGGGANWGGGAFDADRNLYVINTSRALHAIKLIKRENVAQARADRFKNGHEVGPMAGAPYGMIRELILSPLGLPCNPPPWGHLAAIDMTDGSIKWQRSLGNTSELAPLGLLFEWGTPNLGGPMITGSGLIFISATMDDTIRAIDSETGKTLWQDKLPAGGQAGPMTYEWQGKQYVVIAAGGHSRAGTRKGDYIVAYALGP